MTEAALELNTLSKRFDRNEVLKNITARVDAGDVIGLLGLNGAGKTTLLETALGFSLQDAGSARVFGQDSAAMDAATKARIGFVPQRDELLDGMQGSQYLELIAEFYPAWNHELVARLAREWAVPLDMRISKLSIGQRQKLSIISALGHEPDLIILDEPVASLDPLARRSFLKELVDIASTQTRSIIFSTHIVTDLERVASRVWLMQEGVLRIDASMDDMKEEFVRVTLPPGAQLPLTLTQGETATSANVLRTRRDERGGTVALLRVQDSQHDLGPDARVETLPLEDLFLELHA
ncbi:MAG: ABC transporter ATP-binding protein [Pseudomonadota bacterium]|nr:ABC transporter ATP-binding protein [Pseudomonadota bacterium]